MLLTDEVKAHIQGAIEHLESERQQAQHQVTAAQLHIKELNSSITTLQKSLNHEASPFRSFHAPLRPPHLKYANISVRWAILDLLHANNVSAVLSTTMTKHNEVQQLPGGRWELTENGIKAIEYIRTTPKFRRGCGAY